MVTTLVLAARPQPGAVYWPAAGRAICQPVWQFGLVYSRRTYTALSAGSAEYWVRNIQQVASTVEAGLAAAAALALCGLASAGLALGGRCGAADRADYFDRRGAAVRLAASHTGPGGRGAGRVGRAAVLAYAGPRPAAGRQWRVSTGSRHAGGGPSARLSPVHAAGPPVHPAARPDARLRPESVCRADQQPDALSGLPDRLPADAAAFGQHNGRSCFGHRHYLLVTSHRCQRAQPDRPLCRFCHLPPDLPPPDTS